MKSTVICASIPWMLFERTGFQILGLDYPIPESEAVRACRLGLLRYHNCHLIQSLTIESFPTPTSHRGFIVRASSLAPPTAYLQLID